MPTKNSSRKHNLIKQQPLFPGSLEVLWLGVDAGPHEVVVVVGGVNLVEAVRVPDLRDKLRVRVHSLEAQPAI